MKTKRFAALTIAVMMVLSLLTPTLAAESQENIIDLGDGFYVVETITQYTFLRAGNMAYGDKTSKLYQGSTLIGTATLSAAFDISGSSAKATSAVISGTGKNGWTYSSGSTRRSGNTAYGTAVFQSGSTQRQLPISISCSPDGTVS